MSEVFIMSLCCVVLDGVARAELSQKLFKNTYRHFKHCPDLGKSSQNILFM